jgi:hypothetical protein
MKKREEIPTVIAVSIMLAIIPIDRWTFGVLTGVLAILGLKVAASNLRRYPPWKRIAGTGFAFLAILLFMLPAILQRYR